MMFERLKSAIMDILSDGSTWELKYIVALVEEQVKQGELNIRTDDFPCGEERIPTYTSRALLVLREENKVVHVSRGHWKKGELL